MKKATLNELKELQAHYKLRADHQHSLGNFEEAKDYDNLANGLNEAILDLMVEQQETSVKMALIA